MKKSLVVIGIVLTAVILLAAFAGPTLALHTQDPDGRRCASCHSTHQGVTRYLLSPTVSNKDLKEVYGEATVSTSCLACHDGTQGRGVTGGNDRTMFHSGVFDISRDAEGNFNSWPASTATNYSAHQVDIVSAISVPLDQAPGNKNLDHYGVHNDAPLTCASCHNPHGAFGKRDDSWAYLQPNPNGVISGKFYRNQDWSTQWADKDEVEVTLTRVGETNEFANADAAPWMRAEIERTGAYIKYPVAVLINDTWVFSRKPTDPRQINFNVNPISGSVRFDVAGGTAAPAGNTLTARVFKPILVQVTGNFDGTIYEADGTEKTLSGVRIYSASINEWCGACHGYYNNASKGSGYNIGDDHFYGHSITGRGWSQGYATPYTSATGAATGNMNCLSCHYSHGTNENLMVDSLKTLQTGTTAVDRSPANKRYFGGSVCMRCHYESHGYNFMENNSNRPEEFQWQ